MGRRICSRPTGHFSTFSGEEEEERGRNTCSILPLIPQSSVRASSTYERRTTLSRGASQLPPTTVLHDTICLDDCSSEEAVSRFVPHYIRSSYSRITLVITSFPAVSCLSLPSCSAIWEVVQGNCISSLLLRLLSLEGLLQCRFLACACGAQGGQRRRDGAAAFPGETSPRHSVNAECRRRRLSRIPNGISSFHGNSP